MPAADEIHSLLAENQELVSIIAKPARSVDHPDLQGDYATLLAQAGTLDFSKANTPMKVGAYAFPELSTPFAPELEGLGRCFYCIGTSYSGDELVQIHQGTHEGRLAVIDHEIVDWDELEESTAFRDLAKADEDGLASAADVLIDVLVEDGVLVFDQQDRSLYELLAETFESYDPAHADFAAIDALSRKIYDSYVKVLVNSLEKKLEGDTSKTSELLQEPGKLDMDAFLDALDEEESGAPFMATTVDESAGIIEAYEEHVEPQLNLLALPPSTFGFLNMIGYWIRAICYTLDAYLVCEKLSKLEPHVDDLRALLDAQNGSHALSLRVAAVLCALDRPEEALDVLDAVSFAGFPEDAEPFKELVSEHPAFELVRGADAFARFLRRKEPKTTHTGWAYDGSEVVEDLRRLSAFVGERLGDAPP